MSSKIALRRERLGALAIYVALASLLFLRAAMPHFASAYLGRGVDQSFFIWCLVWWPYALANHLNPFVARVIFAPSGLNLTWTTPIPLISWMALPLTAALGPVGAYNLLCVLCPALAAWSAALLCRHLTEDFWAALLGGYLFGFSPYVLGHVLYGHLDCFSVFLIPLVVYLTLTRLEARITRRAFGLWLFVLLVAQFLIADEFFATMTLVGALALAVAWVCGQRDLKRRIEALAAPIAFAYLGTALVVSPWLYYTVVGFVRKPLHPPLEHSADLLNLAVPTPTIELGQASIFLRGISSRFTSNIAEQGAYLGMPLLIIALWFAVTRWRTFAGRILSLMLAVTAVLAMGPRLHIAGVATVALPWRLIEQLPFLDQALPIRISVYTSLVMAIIAARWFGAARARPWLGLTAAVLVIGSLLPNLSAQFWNGEQRRREVPSFFSSGLYRRYLVKNEIAVLPPFNWGAGSESMVWQAEAGMHFRLATGYLPFAPPALFRWPIVTALMQGISLPDAPDQWRAFAASHGVSVVMVTDEPQPAPVEELLGKLGIAPLRVGGIRLYRMRPETLAEYRSFTAVEMETLETQQRFSELLVAAQRYLADDGDPKRLSPGTAAQRGLLSAESLARDTRSEYAVSLFAEHSGSITVGVKGSCQALRRLVERYGTFARSIDLSCPLRPHHVGQTLDNYVPRALVMVFDRDGLRRAAARVRAEPPRLALHAPTKERAGLQSAGLSPQF